MLLIARCIDVADVMKAVRFVRDNGLLVAICGGGRSGLGLGNYDDGLVLDLPALKGVRVDLAWTTPPIPLAWRCRPALSPPPELPASRLGAAWATLHASTHLRNLSRRWQRIRSFFRNSQFRYAA
jgi:FAD/FMN-containing dehydrogenase